MNTPDETRFYLAAPRLVARLRGRDSIRAESNWLEANLLGGAAFAISYLAIGRLLVGPANSLRHLAFAIPVAIVTWLFWLLALYLNSLAIRLLRAAGFMRQLSDARAQSLLIGTTITIAAAWFVTLGSWISRVGLAWILAVCINLLAAALLAMTERNDARA